MAWISTREASLPSVHLFWSKFGGFRIIICGFSDFQGRQKYNDMDINQRPVYHHRHTLSYFLDSILADLKRGFVNFQKQENWVLSFMDIWSIYVIFWIFFWEWTHGFFFDIHISLQPTLFPSFSLSLPFSNSLKTYCSYCTSLFAHYLVCVCDKWVFGSKKFASTFTSLALLILKVCEAFPWKHIIWNEGAY